MVVFGSDVVLSVFAEPSVVEFVVELVFELVLLVCMLLVVVEVVVEVAAVVTVDDFTMASLKSFKDPSEGVGWKMTSLVSTSFTILARADCEEGVCLPTAPAARRSSNSILLVSAFLTPVLRRCFPMGFNDSNHSCYKIPVVGSCWSSVLLACVLLLSSSLGPVLLTPSCPPDSVLSS